MAVNIISTYNLDQLPMTAGAYRLTSSHSHSWGWRVPCWQSHVLHNKPPSSHYSALSQACGMQRRGSACSHLDTENALKSGLVFKQLTQDMDGQAANAWIMAIKQITSSPWLTCSTQFKPISFYPPSLSQTLSAHLYIWLESITTLPTASWQM